MIRIDPVSNTRSYMFTGPDGVQYRWALGAFGMNYPKVSLFPRIATIISAEPRCEAGHNR